MKHIPPAKSIPPPADFGVPRTFAWGWAALMAALTVGPYLWARGLAPEGFAYAWILPPYPEDSIAYQAWTRQAADGRLLFSLKYSAAPHAPFLFHPFFLACGWLARLSGLDLGVVHLLVKTAGVALFFGVFFKSLKHFKLDRTQSVVASFLVGVSSGFGGLLADAMGEGAWAGTPPMDLWLVDANTFWSLLWNPLFPYALILMLLSVLLMDEGTSDGKPGRVWLSGLCVGVLALIHPYETALLCPLLAAIALIRRGTGALPDLARFAAAAGPALVYTAALSALHPLLQKHGAAGSQEMRSPAFVSFCLGLGLPGLLAGLGLLLRWSEVFKKCGPLALWVILSLILSRLPLWFQEKLIFGVHVPVCVLAAVSLGLLFPRLFGPASRPAFLAAAALVLSPLLGYTQVRMLRHAVAEVAADANGDYFVSPDLQEAFRYLRKNSRPSEIVYASVVTSLKIPAYAGNTVIWGHWAQSVGLKERTAWARSIFEPASPLSPAERTREFYATGIRYVLLDGKTREWFERERPLWMIAGADKVFENGTVVIYRRRN